MPALGRAFVRQHQTAGYGSRDFHLLHPCRTLFTTRCETLAELIQVDNFYKGFSAPCNLLSVGMQDFMQITIFLAVVNFRHLCPVPHRKRRCSRSRALPLFFWIWVVRIINPIEVSLRIFSLISVKL